MAKHLFEYRNGEDIELPLLIKSADIRIAKNGKKFIALILQDTSGHMPAKLWDASDAAIEQYKAGEVVHVRGKRELYNDNPQIKLYGMRLATQEEGNDPKYFLERAPEKSGDMEEDISSFVFDILNPNWNRIVRKLLADHHDAFFSYPAAKSNHHANGGGLAFHTLSILRLAKHVGEQYPNINVSLLYAGAILHDMGKTIELSGPVSTEYTVTGNLIGHIVLIDEEIIRACIELKIDSTQEDVVLLRHMILAHHGLLEYGSPVRPQLPEAQILHDLDELDASINMMTTAVAHVEGGQFSERLFGMDNRRFYRPEGIQHLSGSPKE
ncbi:HD domain-containing protein [Lacticaseibacillus pabuli]|uniref:HD domain-containing protein n=1 Tax=Lacticaseibacillus pabuli TaxID=3025672 RepID=A0ABY7WTN5_9LACO|nr:HD domain-containing protein [Lacticaseibacillus sp. KACC 23028]WDF83522.1 HD domain-containing protein [Lacticaseibacillus sp. KACC 23028]